MTFLMGCETTLGKTGCVRSGLGILIMFGRSSSYVGESNRSGISKDIELTLPVGSKATLSKFGLCISSVGETGGSAKLKKTFLMGHGAVLVKPSRWEKLL